MPVRPDLFRREAVDALSSGNEVKGAPLEIAPPWTLTVTSLLTALVVAGLVICWVLPFSDWAEGPAVVRVDGRRDLSSAGGGVVSRIHVQPGDRVEKGATLVRLHSESEEQEVLSTRREFELNLVRVLFHPEEASARQALSDLRVARERAEARLAERTVVAPEAGIVAALRARVGQMSGPGEALVTLLPDRPTAWNVVALVPGQHRPMLSRGMAMRFQLDGYPHTYTSLEIAWVGSEVTGPAEVLRHLGPEMADAVKVDGPLVQLAGRLPERSFVSQGRRYPYFDGIPGRVQIKVRSTPLLAVLLPPLARLLPDGP